MEHIAGSWEKPGESGTNGTMNFIGHGAADPGARRAAVPGGLRLVFAAAVPAGAFLRVPVLSELAGSFAEMKADVGEMSGGPSSSHPGEQPVLVAPLLLTGMLAGVLPSLSVAANGLFMGLIYRHLASTRGRAGGPVPPSARALRGPGASRHRFLRLWLGWARSAASGAGRRGRSRSCSNLAMRRYFTVAFPLLIRRFRRRDGPLPPVRGSRGRNGGLNVGMLTGRCT
jgi:hypothetical protein